MNDLTNCNDFKQNVYSQNGEDGVIAMLLGPPDGDEGLFVIEFGAADGFFCSNTARLWREANADALLIESNPTLFDQLAANTAGHPNVDVLNVAVEDLDSITTRVADVCSIDVDGDDYYIAARMQTPHRIVVIEHNPTVPPHVDLKSFPGSMWGSGAKTITGLMENKGYTLVACTKTNLIFLHGDHRDRYVHDLPTLFDYSSLNYVVTSADGYYDFIGEFGYGFNSPTNMSLSGPGLNSPGPVDDATKEWIRRMTSIADSKQAP